MSRRLKTNLLKYGITTAVCGALAIWYLLGHDFSGQDPAGRYRLLCDAFFLPGIFSVLFGLLIWVANEGAFTGLTYALKTAFRALMPGGRNRQERYYDYLQSRKEKKVTGYGFLFHVGCAFVVISAVFLILFYNV